MVQHDNVLLELVDLHAGFIIDGQFYEAIQDVSFRMKSGRVTCVVGESGSGKSVMALSVMGLLPKGIGRLDKGEIWFNGRNIAGLSNNEMTKIRGKEIGMVFQEPMAALNPVFTIGFQMQEVLLNHLPISKKEARKMTIDLLKQVGISRSESIVDEYPHQLSGGMQQRVLIAIAIACKPKLLIADEPTSALDVSIQAQILQLLKLIQQQENMAMMFITHDLVVVAEIADEVIVMYAGQIIEQGDVNCIFHDPKHPYLKLMLQLIPRLDVDHERIQPIKGSIPSIKNIRSTGCRFVERCPQSVEQCYNTIPLLKEAGTNHYVRCLLYTSSDVGVYKNGEYDEPK